MRDINFFSIYSQKNTSRQTKIIQICIVALGFALIVTAVYFALYLQLVAIRNDTKAISDYLATPKVSEVLKTSKTYEDNLSILKKYSENMAADYSELSGNVAFTSSLMEKLCAVLPDKAKLTTITYNDKALTMEFSVPNVLTASQLDSALSGIEEFKYVFTNSVIKSEQDKDYKVSVSVILNSADSSAETAVETAQVK